MCSCNKCGCLVRTCASLKMCMKRKCGFFIRTENTKRIMVQLLIRMAIVASSTQSIAILAQLIFFATCFTMKDTFNFRSVAFDDCNFPMVEALQLFLIPHFSLAVLCVYGLLWRKYGYILPHLSLAWVYTMYCALCQIDVRNEETEKEFAMDTLIACAEVGYCCLIQRAYLQVRSEACIPPLTQIDYE